MNLYQTFKKMDPHLLVGIINTKLRNSNEPFLEFCKTENLDPNLVTKKLLESDYQYNTETNQFNSI